MSRRPAVRPALLGAALLVAWAGPAAADLVLFGVSPSAPPPGTAITLTFEVRNPERRPLPPGVVDVRARGRSLGHIATPAVPAGGSVKVTGGVTLPDVDDASLRLDLVPSSGPSLPVVLTLTPRRHSGRGRLDAPAPAPPAAPGRSRALTGPTYVGTPQ